MTPRTTAIQQATKALQAVENQIQLARARQSLAEAERRIWTARLRQSVRQEFGFEPLPPATKAIRDLYDVSADLRQLVRKRARRRAARRTP